MRDVATVAGVSLSTVSRVINGEGGVREDLAARVREAVVLLSYRQNVNATTLRRSDGLSASIGLLFEDVSNPFSSAVHRSVEVVARTRNVLTLAGSCDEEPSRERELAESFCARGVDGLIVVPTAGDHSYLLRDRDAGVAFVFVDRPPRAMDADVVLTDNAGGAAAAVAHLVAHGHRRIAFFGAHADIFTAAERLRGYKQALAEHGIPEDPQLIAKPLPRGAGAYECAREMLTRPDPPTALFTSQNLITIAVVQALHDLGLQRQVAQVGFDDVVLAGQLEPGLTVVAQDLGEVGRSAAELLFSRIDGYQGPSRRIVLSTQLVARGSGEIPA
jgi:LacI family transcriptional regulator